MTDNRADEPRSNPDLETEKWRFERECKIRELDLADREQANKDSALELQRADQRSSAWRSPLIVAIFAAAVAGASNAVVTLVNGSLQRDLETNKRDAEAKLEKVKSESGRILEMIKTGDNERAAHNLDFLIQSGLVTDDEIQKKLSAYLLARQPGTGPSLPANSRVGFEDASAMEKSAQDLLQESLNRYLKFLDASGFPPSSTRVLIHVETDKINNAYYDGSRIVIDKRLIDDPYVPLREYTHHVLTLPVFTQDTLVIESGLADYFACSFLGTPKVGAVTAKVLKVGQPFLRDLANNRSFREVSTLSSDARIVGGGEIWGGLFWALRAELGGSATDKLLAATWLQFALLPDTSRTTHGFVDTLLSHSKKLGDAQNKALASLLAKRGFTPSK